LNKDKLWIFGGIALMLAIALGGYVLGVSPVMAQAASVATQTSTIQASNNKTRADLVSLKSQFANIGPLTAKLDKLRGSIPVEANSSAFLNELAVLAAKNGVTITEVTVGTAVLYAAPVATAPATTPTDGSTATPTPAATPAAGAAPAAPVQTVGGGLVLVPIIISSKGAFNNVRNFNGAVQVGTRLFFATEATIATDANKVTTGTLTGDAFTLAGTSNVVTPTTLVPTPDPTETPTATPTPTATSTTSSTGKTGGTGGTVHHTTPPVVPSGGPTTRP
jgi:hypothetical protein